MPMILGLDTSAKTASAAICGGGRIIAQTQLNTPLTHSQTALPMVQSLLDCAKLTLDEMDYLAVSAGPGSFTGVRIGIAAVKAIAFALDKPCIGVSTLEALARNMTGLSGIVCPMMDARCRQVYTAMFALDAESGSFERLFADEAISIDDLEKRIGETLQSKNYGKSVILVGDGAEMCYNIMKDRTGVTLAPPMLVNQTGYGVCAAAEAAALRGDILSAGQLMPVYLRLPQAERERNARLAAEKSGAKQV